MANAQRRAGVSRRAVLRGAGAALTLPWFESFAGRCWGSPVPQSWAPPLRVAFLYVPNGIHMQDWTPAEEGDQFELPKILEPLKNVRSELNILSGLTLDGARAHGDGGGDHARAVAAFLTGAHPRKTDGANIKNGVSIDQVLADKIGYQTRFASLELGIEGSSQSGDCDSGYSCSYTSNLSWRNESTPVPKETDPQALFDRLVGGDDSKLSPAARRRKQYHRSILDAVSGDAESLRLRLGRSDQRKLDEYMHAVREVESRFEKVDKLDVPEEQLEEIARGIGNPEKYEEHVAAMLDMLHLAFLSDSTRVASFMFANAGSNRAYRELGLRGGHHELSHHGGNADKQAAISKINQFHVTMLARFVEKLRATPEGDGNLLDHSMIVYGSGIADGNAHNHHDLPILLLGRGGGSVAPGRHLRFSKETPLTNLYVALAERMGVVLPRFSDSTAALDRLDG